MADQKNAAKKKKPVSSAQKKNAASAKHPKTKTHNGKAVSKAEKAHTSPDAIRQRTSIVLLAVAVLFIAAVFIKGERVWLGIHNFIFGLFGVSAYVWPLIIIYVAVVIALNRSMISVRSNIIGASLFSLLFSGVIHVFSPAAEAGGIKAQIEFVWNLRQHVTIDSGGLFGALFGGIPYAMFGKKAAAVFLIVLLVVTFMFVTGTSLLGIYLFFKDSVEKAEGIREKHRESNFGEDDGEEQNEELPGKRRKKFVPIDISPESEGKDAIVIEELVGNASKKELEPNIKQPKVFVDVSSGKTDNSGIDDIIKKVNNENKARKNDKKVKISVSKKSDRDSVNNNSDSNIVKTNPESENKVNDSRCNVFKTYEKPPVDCLLYANNADSMNYEDELKINAKKLVDTLDSFGVSTKIVNISRGPSVTRYELQPAAGVKISKITGLSDDIALALAASGVRIEAPIPNKSAVGIEIPNKKRAIVSLREIIETPVYKKAKSKLNVALGKDITGNVICADLAKMPHLLIAGTTGSGKSVCLNSMIVSLLYNAEPDEVKLVMIDPKQVEFTVYSGIPHLLVPVVSDPRKAAGALGWAVTEMLQRYKMFSEKAVRDIKGYNKLAATDETLTPMPHIVIFIDELSDLMMAAPNEVEDSICRLAQMARAAGMHLVIATQRPSVNVITGIIKANIPSRIALSVSSQVDSRTIIDTSGAEKLLGYGDMLFSPVGISKPVRVQGCYLSDEEVEEVVKFIKSQTGEKKYDEEVMQEIERQSVIENKKKAPACAGDDDEPSGDEMVPKAIEIVAEAQMASTTLLQRKLKLGYARAARIVDELEERGIIGPFEGSKPRKVLISKQQWMEMNALANASAPIENPIEQETVGEDNYDIAEDDE